MKKITVYKVTSAETIQHSDVSVPIYKWGEKIDDLIHCSNGVSLQKTIEIEHWPIEHYRWQNGNEIYAAIDPTLREILEIEIERVEKLKWEGGKLLKDLLKANKEVENLQHDLENHKRVLDEYVNMSFCQRVKFLFKGN